MLLWLFTSLFRSIQFSHFHLQLPNFTSKKFVKKSLCCCCLVITFLWACFFYKILQMSFIFDLLPSKFRTPKPQWTPRPVCIFGTSPNTSTMSSYTWSSSYCGSAADYNSRSTPSTQGTKTSHQWPVTAYWRIIARITM